MSVIFVPLLVSIAIVLGIQKQEKIEDFRSISMALSSQNDNLKVNVDVHFPWGHTSVS